MRVMDEIIKVKNVKTGPLEEWETGGTQENLQYIVNCHAFCDGFSPEQLEKMGSLKQVIEKTQSK